MKLKAKELHECLDFGNIGEKITSNNFHLIFKPIIEKYLYSNRFLYELNKTKQLNGIDGKINFNMDIFEWETKTRDNSFLKFNDILLETISKTEYNKSGWFFTSKADIIDYLYINKKTEEVLDGYLIIMNKTKIFFSLEKLNEYPKKIASTSIEGKIMWHTENRAIPYKDFPKNSLINIKKLLQKIKIKEQKTRNISLDSWLNNGD